MRTQLLAGVIAALTASAAPAAQAATLTLDKPCIRADQMIGFTTARFAPNEFVHLLLGTDQIDAFPVGADGTFAGQFPSGGVGDAGRLTKTVSIANDSGNAASAPEIVTEIGVAMKPAQARPSRKVKFLPFGFVEGGTLYAHYAFAKSETVHKLVKTVKLGALSGPCGDGSFKVKQLPLKKPRPGVYEIQFDTSAAYRRQEGVYAERTVFVPRKRH